MGRLKLTVSKSAMRKDRDKLMALLQLVALKLGLPNGCTSHDLLLAAEVAGGLLREHDTARRQVDTAALDAELTRQMESASV